MYSWINSWKELYQAISRHKVLFVVLLIIQIITIVLLVYTVIIYQLEILENANAIVNQFATANYDAQSLEGGQPFLQDVLSLTERYNAIVESLFSLFLWLVAMWLILLGVLWALSFKLLNNLCWKETATIWAKYCLSSIVVLLPLTAIIYGITRASIFTWEIPPESFVSIGYTLAVVLFVIYYLLILFFAQLSSKKLGRQFLVKLKKIHCTFLPFLTNALLLGGFLSLLYVSLLYDQTGNITLIITFLFLVCLTITRLYWINSVGAQDKA